jgi:hypothetical protein
LFARRNFFETPKGLCGHTVLKKVVKEFQKHKTVVYVDAKPIYLTTRKSKTTNFLKKQVRDISEVIATSNELNDRHSIPVGAKDVSLIHSTQTYSGSHPTS